MSDEQREQKEAFKKTLRIYSDGVIDYNIRFDVIDYDFSQDEEFKNILDSFENSYTLESIESLKKDTGYEPLISFDEGVKMVLKHMKEQIKGGKEW